MLGRHERAHQIVGRCGPGRRACRCAMMRPSCSISSSSPSLRALGMLCVTTTSVSPPRRLRSSSSVVDFVGGDRIEPGARLVDQQDLRIQRHRARKPGALPHAARQRRRHLVVFLFEADRRQLLRRARRGSPRRAAPCGAAAGTRRSRRPRSNRRARRSGRGSRSSAARVDRSGPFSALISSSRRTPVRCRAGPGR